MDPFDAEGGGAIRSPLGKPHRSSIPESGSS